MVAHITDPDADEGVYYDVADGGYCSVEATTDGGVALVTPTHGDVIEFYEDPEDLPEEDLIPVNPAAVNNPATYVENYLEGGVEMSDLRDEISLDYARLSVEIVEVEG